MMPEYKLATHIATVRAYINSRAGASKMWDLMYGRRALTLDQAIGEVVVWELANCHNGRLREVDAEDIATITERVIAAEWTREPVEAA